MSDRNYLRDAMDNLRIIETADGSHSLYNEHLRETYHSTHGAWQESMHVFIRQGFHKLAAQKKSISILEIGFGTGLNALLTAAEAQKFAAEISYTTLETQPLQADVYNKLNYAVDNAELHQLLMDLHNAAWEDRLSIRPFFSLAKKHISVQLFTTASKFDLIYFDAFGPPAQPEMWTREIFKSMYDMTNIGGSLVTYCAKGQVRRDLQDAGFEIERLPGPPGKREMLRANKLT
jgi:tRNA U34 5-methylaminomethyl-2-thiouridine-forming methyltransferase MnmC